MEAYILMNAINQAFPGDNEVLHRTTDDMHTLNLLPGERFQLTETFDSQISHSMEEQRKWFEQELQTSFPISARCPVYCRAHTPLPRQSESDLMVIFCGMPQSMPHVTRLATGFSSTGWERSKDGGGGISVFSLV